MSTKLTARLRPGRVAGPSRPVTNGRAGTAAAPTKPGLLARIDAVRRARRIGHPAAPEAGPRPESTYRRDIQGLRAVAVVLVVLNHAGVAGLKGGYIGVDVFFVLSGFLITGLLMPGAAAHGFGSLLDFYARRARRILPAAALTLVATDVAAYALLNYVRAKQVLQDSIPASLFTANFHFAGQGTNYFAQGQPASPIQHYWSLAVEEQFYVVWPLILLVVLLGLTVRRRIANRNSGRPVLGPAGRRRLFVVIAAASAASLAWSIHDTAANPAASYFSTLTRVWELGLGAALAIALPLVHRLGTGWRAALGWLGLGAIAAAAVSFSGSTSFPGYAALLPTLGAAFVIAAGEGRRHARVSPSRLLATLPMRFVGDRSYALYLWHWPILAIAVLYKGHALSVGTNLLLVLAALAISIVTYALFENPIRRAKWSAPRRALVLWPASVFAVILVAGWGIGKIDVKETRLADAGAPQYPGLVSDSLLTPGKPASVVPSTPGLQAIGSGQPLPAVVTAVAAARRSAPIPTALTPPVANLLSDHYDYRAGCAAQDGQSSSTICSLGDTAARKSLVVMGDSHVQMWMPAIIAMAKQDGWVVHPIGKSACTPMKWWHLATSTPDCSAWYLWAQREIRALHPDAVLLGGAFTGVGATGGKMGPGLTALISALRSASRHVVVLGDLARQAQQPVDCLLANNATMSTCSLRLTGEELSAIEALASAARSAGASFVDPRPWFCDQDLCPFVIGHTIVYMDRGHITATYASELSATFRDAFQAAIGRRARARHSRA